jgi:GH25 family lysozyme M1 (1,4-beta-N-acetylmuramidase)
VALSVLTALGFAVLGAAPAATAAQATLEGIDVSHWNGQPAWDQVKADGIKFVIAKASEGSDKRDPQYASNKQQVEALGLPFTAYHFARPDTTVGDAVAEADNFVDAAALTGRNLVPVLDLEDNGGLGKRKLVTWTRDWLNEVQVRLGVKATIYTSPAFWAGSMGNTPWFANNGYRLWVAHWGVNQPTVPAANWGGRGWTLWQYTSSGSVAGISGNVDRDRYAGTTLGPLKIKNNR